MDELLDDRARTRELEELGQKTAEPPDLVADDLRLPTKGGPRLFVDAELVDVPPEQMKLQDGRVERIPNLVREVERQRPHRRQRLGVGGTLLERATLRHIDAEAVEQRRLVPAAARHREVPAHPPPRRRVAQLARRYLRGSHALGLRVHEAGLDLLRPAHSSQGDRLAHAGAVLNRHPPLDERPPRRRAGLYPGEQRGLAVEQGDPIPYVEAHDEDVRELDQGAVAALELLAFAGEPHLRESLLDGRDELLGPERLRDERIRARAQGAHRRVDRRESRDEDDLAERTSRPQLGNEVDAARVGQLHVDDGHVEAPRAGNGEPFVPARSCHHFDRVRRGPSVRELRAHDHRVE